MKDSKKGRSRGPDLEEDIALANIALDQLGAARLLLALAGSREQPHRPPRGANIDRFEISV